MVAPDFRLDTGNPSRILARMSRHLISAIGLVLLVASPQIALAQNGPGRLDAGERQRLRMELRQRANDDRAHGHPSVQFQPAAPNPNPGGYAAPMNGPGGFRPDGAPRLSPEERQQLRLQLRESRQR